MPPPHAAQPPQLPGSEPERKRHLLRPWLQDLSGRPISDQLRRCRAGKGIDIKGLKLAVPLDVEQRRPQPVA